MMYDLLRVVHLLVIRREGERVDEEDVVFGMG